MSVYKTLADLNGFEKIAIRNSDATSLAYWIKTRRDRNTFLLAERDRYLAAASPCSLVDFNSELYNLLELRRSQNWKAVKKLRAALKEIEAAEVPQV